VLYDAKTRWQRSRCSVAWSSSCNKTCEISIQVTMAQQTAVPLIPRSRWRLLRGRLEASSIGGSKSTGPAWSGSDECEARTVSNDGSEPLIFVP
jgi:hypothetical protein